MNKKKLISCVLVIACMFLISVPTFAVEARASDQIILYNMAVTPTTDTLNVKFSVTGTGIVNKLGCESIYVYEKSGSSWIFTDRRLEDDSGMSQDNCHAHKNNIYINSESGVEYKVVVTIFSENDAGRDTRTQTFYVTGK